MEPDFSGYVTRTDLTCADGRVIKGGAFAHQDGAKVPLVYQHKHDDISQVLGYTILSIKDDGVWGDSYLNSSPKAQDARAAVQHGDIDKYSIWAKDLQEVGHFVHDGVIQETSLVLAGANPGANILNVLMHSAASEDDLMIVTGEIELKHSDVQEDPPSEDPPADPPADKQDQPIEGDKTVADVLETLTDEQRLAVNSFIDDTVTEAVTEALTEEPALTHSNIDSSEKGSSMTRNIFDQTKGAPAGLPQLKHGDVQAVLTSAKGDSANGGSGGRSLRDLVRSNQGSELMHADSYGVDNIEILFPDAQALMTTPTFVDRRQEWVRVFMAGAHKSPFARIKTYHADITADEARARGYLKGNRKVEEVFPIFKRTTGPAWIYKKQKLDRQDIIDIVDFNVVAWMKVEMRGKLDEELARAALFGDGRPTMIGGELNPDKIQEPTGTSGDGIRSVINDDDLYTTTYFVPLAANPSGADYNVVIDAHVEATEDYMGSGHKTAFMTYRFASKLLTIRDEFGHRIYKNLSEVAGDMDVAQIVRVPTELMPDGVFSIVLDLSDYNFGADKGGEVTLFDDFDIDFNQFKYLMETYLSGALTLPYCAQVFKQGDLAATVIDPTVTDLAPTIADNVITIPTIAGVSYFRVDVDPEVEVADAAEITLDLDDYTASIEARPDATYEFPSNYDGRDTFNFRYTPPSA